MSEYQYYEFQALDRHLGRAAQEALRSISSRARITATSFINHYELGDHKGDPSKFMANSFVLHHLFAHLGTLRLMIRPSKQIMDRTEIPPFCVEVHCVTVFTSGSIVTVH